MAGYKIYKGTQVPKTLISFSWSFARKKSNLNWSYHHLEVRQLYCVRPIHQVLCHQAFLNEFIA